MKKSKAESEQFNRRGFLSRSAAVGGGLLAAPALGAASPSERLSMAFVGTGGMGTNHLKWFSARNDVHVAAVCDVDAKHLKGASEIAPDAVATNDFREVVGREDVDAVLIATPDHWHALVAVAAAKAGKHVYCEKPLANSVGEGRAVADAAREAAVVFQTGCHERSNRGAQVAKQVVEEGRLGKVHTVKIRLPNSDAHLQRVENFTSPPPDGQPPKQLDWDFWLGPAKAQSYNQLRCHFWWRFHSQFGGGEITDRGAHVIDLAHFILGLDNTGPLEISAKGKRPAGDFFDAFITFEFENQYPGGLKIIGDNQAPRGLTLIGPKGELSVGVHGCDLKAEPASLLDGIENNKIAAYAKHREDWLKATRGEGKCVAPPEAGHRTATACHLNNLSMRLGKSFRWDPKTEQSDDDQVNALLSPKMRPPWSV